MSSGRTQAIGKRLDGIEVTNQLSQFVAGSQWEAIPPEVRREGARALLNFFGCALGGTRDAAMDIAAVRRYVSSYSRTLALTEFKKAALSASGRSPRPMTIACGGPKNGVST